LESGAAIIERAADDGIRGDGDADDPLDGIGPDAEVVQRLPAYQRGNPEEQHQRGTTLEDELHSAIDLPGSKGEDDQQGLNRDDEMGEPQIGVARTAQREESQPQHELQPKIF
jgi:hypothetical protein